MPKTPTPKVPLTLGLVGLSILLLLIFGGVWWRFVYANPERVFNGMLNNSLRLQSVSKEVKQTGSGQEISQLVHLQFGSENRVFAKTHLEQSGDIATTVDTETIGTPTADYVRYTNVTTNQKNANGQPLDFSNLLNVWGGGQSGDKITGGQLYNETVLGMVPFAYMNQAQRRELLDMMNQEKIYEVDYSAVQKSLVNGRPRYIYSVGVDVEAYIKLLKRFGELHGLNSLTNLDPAAYASEDRLPFTFTVDVWSRQLQKIEYVTGDRTETYGSHNARQIIDVPKETITMKELEARLQELQQ